MTDHCSFDLGAVTVTLIVVVAMVAIVIRLIPALRQMVWQVLPGILALWLIVAVLRGMVKKLLG